MKNELRSLRAQVGYWKREAQEERKACFETIDTLVDKQKELEHAVNSCSNMRQEIVELNARCQAKDAMLKIRAAELESEVRNRQDADAALSEAVRIGKEACDDTEAFKKLLRQSEDQVKIHSEFREMLDKENAELRKELDKVFEKKGELYEIARALHGALDLAITR